VEKRLRESPDFIEALKIPVDEKKGILYKPYYGVAAWVIRF
jgi:hypothetical protein